MRGFYLNRNADFLRTKTPYYIEFKEVACSRNNSIQLYRISERRAIGGLRQMIWRVRRCGRRRKQRPSLLPIAAQGQDRSGRVSQRGPSVWLRQRARFPGARGHRGGHPRTRGDRFETWPQSGAVLAPRRLFDWTPRRAVLGGRGPGGWVWA